MAQHLRAKTFEELRTPLIVTATDLNHGVNLSPMASQKHFKKNIASVAERSYHLMAKVNTFYDSMMRCAHRVCRY
ncbi:MAG: hypothetical protein LBK47_07400 [Prevotellaceae bacterium]|nr:hypothetical protein [Prevotellaceae bacterium]